MTKTIAKKAVTERQYLNALEAYRKNEIASRAKAAERDQKIAKLDEKYNPYFEVAMQEQQSLAETIQEYCENNRAALFGDKQTAEQGGVILGFRKGQFSVAFAEGKDEEAVIKLLKKHLPDYVKVTESIDKKRLITDRADVVSSIKKVGLVFEPGKETFSIKVPETKTK